MDLLLNCTVFFLQLLSRNLLVDRCGNLKIVVKKKVNSTDGILERVVVKKENSTVGI